MVTSGNGRRPSAATVTSEGELMADYDATVRLEQRVYDTCSVRSAHDLPTSTNMGAYT